MLIFCDFPDLGEPRGGEQAGQVPGQRPRWGASIKFSSFQSFKVSTKGLGALSCQIFKFPKIQSWGGRLPKVFKMTLLPYHISDVTNDSKSVIEVSSAEERWSIQ